MSVRDEVLAERRRALLLAISINDLAAMRARVTGEKAVFRPGKILRREVFEFWDAYAAELSRHCAYTITGESIL